MKYFIYYMQKIIFMLFIGFIFVIPVTADPLLKQKEGYLFARIQAQTPGWSLTVWKSDDIGTSFSGAKKAIYSVPVKQKLVLYKLPEGDYQFYMASYHKYNNLRVLEAECVHVTSNKIVYAGDVMLEPVYKDIANPFLNYHINDNYESAVEELKQKNQSVIKMYKIEDGISSEEKSIYKRALPYELVSRADFTASRIPAEPVLYDSSEPAGNSHICFDAGSLVQQMNITDCGVYVPVEFQYHFAQGVFAFLGGLTVSHHQTQNFDTSVSVGIRQYNLPCHTIPGTGVFISFYPLYEISPIESISNSRFIWNTELEIGITRVVTKHLFFDAAIGWLFTDIPYSAWYVGGLKFSLKFGFAF